jgi:hypothetical protein
MQNLATEEEKNERNFSLKGDTSGFSNIMDRYCVKLLRASNC